MRAPAREVPAVYMRGGTSKGVFFHARDLPPIRRERDAALRRIIGSPDPYGRHTDGMGGATSSTSKVVIISPSARPDCDVEYLFGAVSIEQPLIDWSGSCGNLAAAVGPFAISEGLLQPGSSAAESALRRANGYDRVRIWQQNLGQRIDAWVPVREGQVVEQGAYAEDGVAFPGAEIRLEYIDPADRGRLHHAFTATGSIALAVAAAIPGTIVSEVARTLPGVPTRIGHLSGTMAVGAEVVLSRGRWRVQKCMMSRSARRLMRGVVFVAGGYV